ncbi:glycoside hydrolase family 43 protein [Streptomyces phaeolivaceus]|uniref:Glycoside hydrolase family 43 protein n=1 Tax=Streptomyces phaeolivaceus TaxID=2653200 RepID=A0A5P8KD64_9ACTN|nr:family 43 glycosylhydrolase [Streptomyces phaeolivaceus]QFR01082.1 glycoside hydrolase family 43 protein [Streptomyces phaeolivaceus]
MTVARNPVIRGFAPDPSLIRVGEWYYVATSSFEWFPTIPIHRSRDLAHGEYAGHVRGAAPGGSLAGVPDSGGVRAPSLSCDGDRFWVVYTIVRSVGTRYFDLDTYVSTAPAVDGDWTAPRRVVSHGFDPALFHHEGRLWLLDMQSDHRPGGERFAGIVLTELDRSTLRPLGDTHLLLQHDRLIEGPKLLPHDGWYYLVLAEARDRAWSAYWAGDTGMVSTYASRVMLEGQVRFASATGAERERLGSILASTYRVVASCSTGFGQRDLALSALTTAKSLAREVGNPVLSALLDSTLSWVYLRGAKLPRAVAVAERAALAIEPSFSDGSRPQLIAYGRNMISAAVAASRREDGESADNYLSQAHAAAARLGRDEKLYGTSFGPTAAKTEAVGIHVALKDYGRALQLANQEDLQKLPQGMSKIARNRYKLDVALAQASTGLYDKAGDTLVEVGMDAPEWVRHQALPGVIGKRLARVSTAKVRQIGDLIGVPLIS